MTELDRLMERINQGREYRNMPVMEARSGESGDQKVVEGYATTFENEYEVYNDGTYRVMESVDSNAFEGCDMSDCIMQYNHQGHVFAAVRNGTLVVQPDAHGLACRADLSGTELGRQVWEEIRGGYTQTMSMGFRVAKHDRRVEEDKETGKVTLHRKILRFSKLFDVSAVSLPANDATEISVRCLGEGVIKEIAEERRRRSTRNTNLMNRLKILGGRANEIHS